MKTIAAAAIVAILSAPVFAADDKTAYATDTPKARTPVVLTATQMDGVTAGIGDRSYTYDANGNLTGWTDSSRDEPGVGGVTIYSDLNHDGF